MSASRTLLSFELRYQLRQPAFWVALAGFVTFGVLAIATNVGGLEAVRGRVPRNAPVAIVSYLQMMSAIGMFAAFVFVAGAVVRDAATGTEPLILSKPISSRTLVLARFTGGIATTFLVLGAGTLAMIVTEQLLARTDADLLAPRAAPYVFGLAVALVPNVLVFAAAIFVLALRTGRLGAAFVGLFVLMIAQDVAEAMPVATFGQVLPGLLDPLGFAALASATRYWSVAEYAGSLPAIGGLVLANRLLWTAVAVGLVALGVLRFDPRRTRRRSKRAATRVESSTRVATVALPRVAPSFGRRTHVFNALRIARFEVARMARSLAFVMIVLIGVAAVIFAIDQREAVAGVGSLPLTRVLLYAVERTALLPLTALAVLFSGETVWRERSTRMSDTFDALPVPLGAVVAGKYLAVALLLLGATAIFGVAALATQNALGFESSEPELLATGLLLQALPYLVFAALAIAVQTIAGSRLLGYLVIGLLLVGQIGLRGAGYTDPLYDFGGRRVPLYSDIDGWGHSLAPYLWAMAYWGCIAVAALALALLMWPRGVASSWAERVRRARARCGKPAIACATVATAGAAVIAGLLVFQTSGPRDAPNRARLRAASARYESAYRARADAPLPRVTAIRGEVDLWPMDRTIEVRARYELVNPHDVPLRELDVSLDPGVQLVELDLDGTRPSVTDADLGMYTVSCELAPGATAELEFRTRLELTGFGRRPADRWVRQSSIFLLAGTGTHDFFQGAQLFPTLGYDRARELKGTSERRRHGLGPWSGLTRPDESGYRPSGETGADAVHVELVVSTEAEHSVVAPGVREEEWEENGRRFFRYATEAPIRGFFPIVSGRFSVLREQFEGVDIELYYHPEHDWNVERILSATRLSLEHLTRQLGPYPMGALRLAEIPGYGTFACSFPGVMAFAEPMGFISPPLAEDGSTAEDVLDPVLWVVAHEVAHQWWDVQVSPARAQGSTMVSETLAQYGSMRVMQEEHGDAMALRFAEYNRELYLRGRTRGGREERPLATVEDQDFVHYGKGFVAMRALARQIGADRVDAALRSIVDDFGVNSASFPTTRDVLDRVRADQPPEIQAWIDDTFERIVFLEAGISSATVRQVAEGWALEVELFGDKYVADGDGNEQPALLADRVEIAVYGATQAGEPLTTLSMRLESGGGSVTAVLDTRPERVRLDPQLLYMDRNLLDNELAVTLEEATD